MKVKFNLEAFKSENAPSYKEVLTWKNFKEKLIQKTNAGEFVALGVFYLFLVIISGAILSLIYETISNPLHLRNIFDNSINLDWRSITLILSIIPATLYTVGGFLKTIRKELTLDKFAADNSLKFSNGRINQELKMYYKCSFFAKGSNFNFEIFSNSDIYSNAGFEFGNFRKSEVDKSLFVLIEPSLIMSHPTEGFILLRGKASALQAIYDSIDTRDRLNKYEMELVGDQLYLWRKKPFNLTSLHTYREVERVLNQTLDS